MLSPSVDGRSLVSDGQAGHGAAFLLDDEWKNPLATGLKLDAQDKAQQAANAKAAAAQKAAADKLAAAKDKELQGLMTLDTDKAWDVDQPAIRQQYNDLVAYTQKALAAGRNPADPRNVAEWGELQRQRKAIQDATASSMQQAERFKSLATLLNGDKDNVYDREAVQQALDDYRKATPAERALMNLDAKRFVSRANAITTLMAKVDQTTKETQTADRHNSTHLTSDTRYTDQQLDMMATSILEQQGQMGKLEDEYRQMTPEQKKAFGPAGASFETWAKEDTRRAIQHAEGQKHKDIRATGGVGVWQPRQPSEASLKYARDAADNKRSVTTAFNEAKSLFDGNPQVFTQQSREYKGLYESTAYNGMSLGGSKVQQRDEKGKYSEVENRVLGIYHDYDNGKTYIKTTASSQEADPRKRLQEVTESSAGQQLLRPIFGKNGGKGDVVDRLLTDNNLADGQGRVRFGPRAADFDQAGYDQRKGTGKLYQQQQERAVATIDKVVGDWDGDDDPGEKRAGQMNAALAGGSVKLELTPGEAPIDARNVRVTFSDGNGLFSDPYAQISYEDQNGQRKTLDQKFSKAQLAEVLKTYQLDAADTSRPVQRSSAPVPANTTTVKTGSGSSKVTAERQRGPVTSADVATAANQRAGSAPAPIPGTKVVPFGPRKKK